MAEAIIPTLEVILVPAGAEHRAVQRAMRSIPHSPQIVPIPAGPQALQQFLAGWAGPALSATGGILLLGLGGSLSPQLGVGDRVLLTTLWDDGQTDTAYPTHGPLTQWIAQQLPQATVADGVSCDRVVTTIAEKRALGDRYGPLWWRWKG
ncbi:MAG: hypothetical protein HC812_15120 [Leptolyngbya sp. RL_3_1]|nr:hypothetical protein [Leptolyngbya sp. RL_3_1]